jgi:hypothetical protein
MQSRETRRSGETTLSDEEIELVAELLAKIGGTWYPERTGATPRAVGSRHRDVAQLIVDAVDRLHATRPSTADDTSSGQSMEDNAPGIIVGDQLHIGATVEYSPPGDKRTFPCRIEKMEDGRAYLVPADREIGWVSTHTLLPLKQPRKTEAQSRSFPPAPPNEPVDAYPEAVAIEAARLNPNLQTRIGEPPTRVQHYFNSFGDWIAFRRHRSDRYLFDRKGNWIGWFPWNDNDAVDLNGQYLGTVMDGNRFYQKTSPDPTRSEAGFVVHPGPGGYAGYPGHAAHRVPPFGFKDIDVTRIPTGRRFWLKSNSSVETTSDGAGTFEIWMSKIGLGFLANWILRRSGRPGKP